MVEHHAEATVAGMVDQRNGWTEFFIEALRDTLDSFVGRRRPGARAGCRITRLSGAAEPRGHARHARHFGVPSDDAFAPIA
ncbi:MAG TPA: hypothetical protein VLB47_00905 [Solirubrobacteraceae bacterium]|nr:hypothetical protein [Solirubrobacteraceae bacterium]